MSVRKFSFSSLFLLLVSATSTGLTSQAGSAATSQALSYSPIRQTTCGCPRPPAWEQRIKSTYRPHIYCSDISPLARAVKRTIYCPDFHRTYQGYTTDPESPVRLAYDPVERDAAKEARDAAARGHSPREVLDAAGRGINGGEVLGGAIEGAVMGGLTGGPGGAAVGAARGATTEAINGAVGGVVNHCSSCHGVGRHRNPN